MTKKTKKNGFTLIELMIVVAIIGILASIALPSYQNFVVRAQVSDSMTLLASARTDIQIEVTDYGSFPADEEALKSLGTGTTSTYGKLTTGNVNGADGDLIYTFTSGNKNIQSKTVTYSLTTNESGETNWTCSSTLDYRYTPKDC